MPDNIDQRTEQDVVDEVLDPLRNSTEAGILRSLNSPRNLIETGRTAITNSVRAISLGGFVEEEIFNDDVNTRPASSGIVVFEVQPNVSEMGTASYTQIDNIRQPGTLMIYAGSPGREFSISAKFVSRSVDEAEKNSRYVQLLRSWRLPDKSGTVADNDMPPAPSRLRLSGLSGWFKSVPVRMTSLSIETNEDVDYINCSRGAVPIVWNVQVSLKESRSLAELNEFDIDKFRRGVLPSW